MIGFLDLQCYGLKKKDDEKAKVLREPDKPGSLQNRHPLLEKDGKVTGWVESSHIFLQSMSLAVTETPGQQRQLASY